MQNAYISINLFIKFVDGYIHHTNNKKKTKRFRKLELPLHTLYSHQ